MVPSQRTSPIRTVRDLAVERVDGRHGFTMEFAPNPYAHKLEYDDEERALAEWADPEPIARIDSPNESEVVADAYTQHLAFARCPECSHATVGLVRPWVINHKIGCSVPKGGYGAR